ncbi:unnamed protein product [Fraxinus pennsylvanica]|uniref:Retrovirus-related Pol polyprotein from transposon TNT 1-94 n=1 Tax=Fraxinus pennsylvanica TaxID=56036 RepID=A0AAD2E616_9LAMI|nr:unnamed protein product [Fraxinus pennsylvanica]
MPWIFRYLRGYSNAYLHFGRNTDGVTRYVDLDYVGNLDKRRLLIEAEYIAITEACKEAMWLRRLIGEISEDLQFSTVYCDSESAIFLNKHQIFHERTKHINVMYHFVCDVIANGDIVVRNVDTKNNPTDMMTKSLSIDKFEHYLNLVGVRH